nr:unnamed protein product [Callosobruchus analis]
MSSYSLPPRPCGHTGMMYGCEHCERMKQTYTPRPCGHMGPTFGCGHCEGAPHYPTLPGSDYEPTAPPQQPPDSYPSYPPQYPSGPRHCGHTGVIMSWNQTPYPAPGYGPPGCNCGPPTRPGEAKHCHCVPPSGPPVFPGPNYVPGAMPFPSAPPACNIVPAPQPPSCTIVPAPQAKPCGHSGIMYGCSHCEAFRHHHY